MSWIVLNEPGRIIGDFVGLPTPLARAWTIGNSVDDYGFSSGGGFGALSPDAWFDQVNTVAGLFVDDSSSAVILRASDDSQWDGQATVTLRTEGFSDVVLTYNSTFYVAINSDYTAYIVGQVGNSLGLSILPELVIQQRTFITADPVLETHFTMQNAKTFAGDFEFEFEISTTASGADFAVLGSAAGDDVTMQAGGNLRITDGVNSISFTTAVNDGKLHRCRLKRVAGNVELFIDEVSDGTGTLGATMSIDQIGRDTTTNHFDGVIANVTLTDMSLPSNSESWRLDQPFPTTTEQSSSGSNLLAYVNADSSTRESFTLIGGDWFGVELWTLGDVIGINESSTFSVIASEDTSELANGETYSVKYTNDCDNALTFVLGDASPNSIPSDAGETVGGVLVYDDGNERFRFQTLGAGDVPLIGDIIDISTKRILETA